ncbi:MAG: SRPBCC family protein [Pseudomonadota bacterium]
MAHVTVDRIVKAPPLDVWQSWDDFGNIAAFNPNLSGSHLLDTQTTGLGATRQCDLSDGKNHIRERIVEYVPGERMVVDIYDGTMPLKAAKAVITLTPQGKHRTRVQMRMEFVPKFGALGVLMVPLMKPQFRKMLRALLDGNAAHVEGLPA